MTPPEALSPFLESAWSRLSRGVADSKSVWNRPTLATQGPRLRTVVLRAVDRAGATLDVHSHAAAGKVGEILAEPAVALHVWDARASLQARLRGTATVEVDTPASEQAFAKLPAHGQAIYRMSPTPGQVIADPDMAATDGPPQFALIRMRVEEIELLHLARERHSRAIYTRAQGWEGAWLVP